MKNLGEGVERMERKEELDKIKKHLGKDVLMLLEPLFEQVLFLENKLAELQELPFIIVNSSNNKQQKVTPAYKMYKEFSQTYLNAIKVINSALGIDESGEDSPLRAYFKKKNENNE